MMVQNLATSGQNWSMLAGSGPSPAEFGPNSVEVTTSLAESGPTSVEFAPIRPRCGSTLTDFDQHRPGVGPRWLSSTGHGPIWAHNGQHSETLEGPRSERYSGNVP